MKACDEVLELLPEYLPANRGWVRAEALELHEHLRLCPACGDAADELAHTLHVLRSEAPPPPLLSPDLADRILAALPAQEAPLTASPLRLGRGFLPLVAAATLLFLAGASAARWLAPTAPLAERPAPEPPPAGASERPAPVLTVSQPPQEPRTRAARPAWPAAQPTSGAPLTRYGSEVELVLQAVSGLERPDAGWLDVMSRHIHEAELVEQGELLLRACEDSPDLSRLISGTQMLLLKLRNARDRQAPAAVEVLRREVREAGLLRAWRSLREEEAADEPAPFASPESLPASTDPL